MTQGSDAFEVPHDQGHAPLANGGDRTNIVSRSSTAVGDHGTSALAGAPAQYARVHRTSLEQPASVREGEWMTQRKPENKLDPDVQAHIGRQLRAGYVDILNQPVPDRFLELLAELDTREGEADRTSDELRQNGSR